MYILSLTNTLWRLDTLNNLWSFQPVNRYYCFVFTGNNGNWNGISWYVDKYWARMSIFLCLFCTQRRTHIWDFQGPTEISYRTKTERKERTTADRQTDRQTNEQAGNSFKLRCEVTVIGKVTLPYYLVW